MITIHSTTFDLDGTVELDVLPDSPDGETRRRVTRVATLDGGVAMNDRGYAEGDRDLSYTWKTVSKDHNEALARIVRLYPRVHVSTPSGCYLAAPQVFTPGAEESTISLLVIDKVSA